MCVPRKVDKEKVDQATQIIFIESIKEKLRLTMYEYDYLNEKEIDEKIIQILSSISDEDLEAMDFNMLCFEVKKQLMALI